MFNHAKVVLLTVFVVFAATGIQSDGQTGMKQSNANKIPPGDWGGNGIHAIVDDSGISIELDCATANIENQIRLERRGRFSAKGSFTEAPRGPIRVGFEPKSQPAHFSGAITGRTMSLKITIDSTRETVGTYSLVRGKQGVLHRCR